MSFEGRAESRFLKAGRAAYDEHRWAEAFDSLVRAQRTSPLEADDLDRLVWSAALIGDDDAFLDALRQLHELCLERGSQRLAARAAFWIGFRLLSVGTPARAGGWLARAERYVSAEGDDCAEKGYLLLPVVFRHLGAQDTTAAEGAASEAVAIGLRAGDVDLVALARSLLGRALVRQGRVEEGLGLLDEVMVATVGGELSPIMTGIVYCSVIDTCQQISAIDRAREWTSALSSWCDAQPQLVNFTGTCLVHRAAIMQLGGDWHDAQEAVRLVCEGASADKDPEVLAAAWYQNAEILRVRGELAQAEEAYRLASEHGCDPQPGLALLRLAQGRVDEAVNAVDRLLAEAEPEWKRAQLLPAFFEVMVAAGRLDEAKAAADELGRIADRFGTEILGAMAARARGTLALELGNPRSAIDDLRMAFRVWHRVGAPHVSSRIRVEMSRAFEALGDVDGARLELEAALRSFEVLGAAPDVEDVHRKSATRPNTHGLSPRELEVLRLVATGRTNRSIARELFISQRTVDRHVSNIFRKLGVSSRTAAAAFAYEKHLT